LALLQSENLALHYVTAAGLTASEGGTRDRLWRFGARIISCSELCAASKNATEKIRSTTGVN